VVPPRPDSSQNGGAKKKGQESRLVERIDKLMQQLVDERREYKEEIERQRQENEGLKQQLSKLIETLT
jgi:HPt (histidine-containing phosphotransfer) domain-containing protein